MSIKPITLGIQEALERTLGCLVPLGVETVALEDCVDRVASDALEALVDSPSVNASLKDGYAVISSDIRHASPHRPVPLRMMGLAAAGGEDPLGIAPGTTVRVLTGARIPDHADAVLSEEFTARRQDTVEALNVAEPGRNILKKGSDVAIGETIVSPGQVITPGLAGLLAAAGQQAAIVYRTPSVAIMATGDEVVIPGQPLPEGKLYASNLTTLNAWCRRYGFTTRRWVVQDDADQIAAALELALAEADAVITSGGAWTGDRDRVIGVLQSMGWKPVFHRIRIGPGKGVGFGLFRKTPVFILPGGPPSNLMGFLQIALPGLLRLSGRVRVGLPIMSVRMAEAVHGRSEDWTQYLWGRLELQPEGLLFHPLRGPSRLRDMAEAQAVVAIPEGETTIPAGKRVPAQWLM